MPDNKRQHFVPQSTLRHFACDTKRRQINIINIKSSKVIRGASLRDQCYRDYFYGKITDVEKALSQLEGLFGAIVQKMISSGNIDLRNGYYITMMVALQKSRTLRAEEEINAMVDKLTKLMMFGRLEEDVLRKGRIQLTGAVRYHVGQALLLSPIMLDLKQFLIVNHSAVPFVISDNPVVMTNWFGRSRFRGRSLEGMARSGLQVLMPLSPTHALLLHDSNVYTTDSVNNVMSVTRDQAIVSLNELQWLNAYKNVYFPPNLADEHIQGLLRISRINDDLVRFERLESVGETGLFTPTEKDEFTAPTKGVTTELVRFGARTLPKDIRVGAVKLRAKPLLHDDGTMGSPKRDPAWCQIIEDFTTDVEAGERSFADLWTYVERHHLTSQIGP